MGFKSPESKPKSYNHYVRKVEPGPGSFGTRPCARCWMRYFCKMVLIDILTTQNACLLTASPTPDISFKMTFQAMGMALRNELFA